ncbi:hypothetical protein AZF37_02690 [endosymbiont 'TC1' of Trimyema compressum]|uniref:InlB B-repeat-containing protein n=1 Tax=endosymbiont 'TC1' of Trimyema compressum TaxID=243899 RepID=UPI0007F15325|nr:InlB B-repeat-containing protein [endosymbiont 'TC1' of Trimyema compressum]AMP20225.1 hypothetical protein AZF37_02690 [endosymbiont 'TC1' of Trimyema compressum]
MTPIEAMGESVLPNSGTGNYTLNGNDITWDGLTKDTTSVNFNFNKTITVGYISSDFSGAVIQPLKANNRITAHTLTFNLNGGNGIAPENQVVKIGDLAKVLDNPIREGYIFSGWNTAPDGSGLVWDFDTTTMPNSDITLYAQWQQNMKSESLNSGNKLDNQNNKVGNISR